MKKIHSAAALFALGFTLSGSIDANAQNREVASTSPTPAPAAAVTAPAAAKSPWKLVYFTEYTGPRFTDIQMNQTQSPYSATPEYAEFDHWVKAAYGFAKNLSFGTQIRWVTSFQPDSNLIWKDVRLYLAWSHMIENSTIDMTGTVDLELPTSDKSKNNGKVVGFRFKNNWVVKTELRNWFFSALTIVNTQFNQNPTGAPGSSGTTDLSLAIYPWITVDVVPSLQILIEAGFDGSHTYNSAYFDLSAGDPDNIDIGPLWTINSHLNVYPAIRFYPGNIGFSTATLYFALEASL